MDKLIRSTDIYPEWHFQPLRLLKNEIENPMNVLHEFFWGYQLPEARKHFKEMFEDAMCNVEVYAINYLTFYDDVEKLIEAAWLIWNDYEKKAEQPLIKPNEDESFLATLQLLVGAINPERIFLLAKEDKQLIDLLIIVPDKEAKPFKHYEAVISTLFYNITDLSFSLHSISSIQEQITAGSPFYLYALTPDKEVYTAQNATPLSIPQPSTEKTQERRNNWKATQRKANDFFECAKHCFETGSFSTSLFMLHQAAELSLYGLICTLWGREIKEHSLSILYRHIRRLHSPELNKLLSPQTNEAKEQLHLLESAYLKSRYNNTFNPNSEQLTSLLQWTLDILDACAETAATLLINNDNSNL